MTKAQIIEAINRRFQNKWHPNIISFYVSQAIEKFIYPQLKKDPSNYDMFTKEFENQEVKFNEGKKSYYVDLPVPIIQLIKTGDGVREIHTPTGKGILFTPVSAAQANILSTLEVFKIQDRIRYIVRRDKIEFFANNQIENIGKVTLSLAIPFSSYDEDDEITLPSGQGFDLIEMVFRTMQNKPVDDIANDTNEKTK